MGTDSYLSTYSVGGGAAGVGAKKMLVLGTAG